MRYLIMIGVVLLISTQAFRMPMEIVIKGKVTDEKDKPMQGVAVAVKGTKTVTTTAQDGSFTITTNKEKPVLVVSSVGYKIKEIRYKDTGKPLLVKMKPANLDLEEVAVIGYGKEQDGTYDVDWRRAKRAEERVSAKPLSGAVPAQGIGGSRPYFEKAKDNSWRYNNNYDREGYDAITENRFLKVNDNPLSTFSIDVDAASYSNIRRMLNMGQMPPAGAVRIEEMINYFHYEYPQPRGEDPFSINTEIADCPWNNKNKLVLIGLQGKQIPMENLPASNLVFLIDVSGSMMDENKLPLVRQSMKLLVDQLRPQDKVAIVVYAGNAGLVLPSTSGESKTTIKEAIDRLEAGGSTAGGAGIKLAYKVARDNFAKEGNNRVILCTDGDFNVGASSDSDMESLIEEERKSGVFLTVLGYGMGNYQDAKMQKLADKGNGNHAYIDNFSEARKVLVSEFGGTLFTIAKDVKLQIEFNPAKVQAYRLIGYENRILNKEDFNNDKKDAGELGSGHTVTALYEVIPIGVKSDFIEKVDKLKYQNEVKNTPAAGSDEIMTVKFRYKKPDGDKSKLIEHPVIDKSIALENTSENFRFAASVAQFGMLLRNSEFKQSSSYNNAWKLASGALGDDKEGYRSEMLKLMKNAQSLAKKDKPEDDGDDVSKK